MSKIGKSLVTIIVVAAIAAGAWFFKDQLMGLLGSSEVPVEQAQEILREANTNGFNIKSAAFDMDLKASLTESADGNGKIDIQVKGKNSDIMGFMANQDYAIKAKIDLDAGGQTIKAGGHLNFRIVDKNIYAKINNVVLPQEIPELAFAQAMIGPFQGNWYFVPFEKMIEENPETASILAEQEETQKKMIQALKKVFGEKDIYTVKSATVRGDKITMKVDFNLDLIISEEFLGGIFEIMTVASEAEGSDFEVPSDEDLAETLAIAKDLYTQINPEITLIVSKSDKLVTSQKIEANVDLASLDLSKLGVPNMPENSGKLRLSIISDTQSINSISEIEAPADAKDFSEIIPQPPAMTDDSYMELEEMEEMEELGDLEELKDLPPMSDQ